MKRILEKSVIIIGILIILYPFVSNWIISSEEKKLITKYEEKTENLTKEQIIEIKEKANEYNENLDNEKININTTVENNDFVSYYNVLDLGNVIAYIDIPKINVNLPIYHGTSDNVLESGVGSVDNTSLPIGGKGTHSVLSAHTGLVRAKMFDNLNKLEIGDVFYIHILDDVLQYEIDQIKTVLPEETEDLKIFPEKDYITLVTCTPYMINTHRLLVRGTRNEEYINEEQKETVSSNPKVIFEQKQVVSENKNSNIIIKAIALISIIIIIIVVILFIRKRHQNPIKKPRIEKKIDVK